MTVSDTLVGPQMSEIFQVVAAVGPWGDEVPRIARLEAGRKKNRTRVS